MEIDRLRTMTLHGDSLNDEERRFVLKQFFLFVKLTNETNFESFKEWITWEEDKRLQPLMSAKQAFKLVTEKGLPFELIESGLEEQDYSVSFKGFESCMNAHRNISKPPNSPNSVF